jgi:hypothetical protein
MSDRIVEFETEEALCTSAASDDSLEIAAGSSAEGAPTLAFGSYCFTCPTAFDEA